MNTQTQWNYVDVGSSPTIECFPRKPNGDLDKKALKKQFEESPHTNWISFCQEHSYPWNYPHIPWGAWQRGKKATQAWRDTAVEMNDRLAMLEPNYARRSIATLESMPATFMGLWSLISESVKREIERPKNAVYPPMDPISLSALANAAHRVSESLYKCLGITDPRKAPKELADRFNAIDMSPEDNDLSEIKVERLTSTEVTGDMKELFDKYVDKPYNSGTDV